MDDKCSDARSNRRKSRKKVDRSVLSKDKYEPKVRRNHAMNDERKNVIRMPNWTSYNITRQNRITRRLGIFTNGKKSDKVERLTAPVLSEEMKARADEDLLQIIALANREGESTGGCTRNSPKLQPEQTPDAPIVHTIFRSGRLSYSRHVDTPPQIQITETTKSTTSVSFKAIVARLHTSLERKYTDLFPETCENDLDFRLRKSLRKAYAKRVVGKEVEEYTSDAVVCSRKEEGATDAEQHRSPCVPAPEDIFHSRVKDKTADSAPPFEFQPQPTPTPTPTGIMADLEPATVFCNATPKIHNAASHTDDRWSERRRDWVDAIGESRTKRPRLVIHPCSPDSEGFPSWRAFRSPSPYLPSPLSPDTRQWTIPARPMF